MISHMLLKHKENPNVCVKCKKKFDTSKHLDDHIQNSHNPNNNLHACTHCEAKFLVAHALKQHTQAVHKVLPALPVGHPERADADNNARQKAPTKFNCRMCGKAHTSGTKLDEHMHQCTQGGVQGDGFSNKECRRGPQCNFLAQNRCKFFHPLMQQQMNQPSWQQNQQRLYMPQQRQNQMPLQHQWMIKPCRRGPGCTFWAAGTCYYSHEEVDVPNMWYQAQQQDQVQKPRHRPVCRYLEDCNRVPYCPFRHYDEDFPESMGNQRKN